MPLTPEQEREVMELAEKVAIFYKHLVRADVPQVDARALAQSFLMSDMKLVEMAVEQGFVDKIKKPDGRVLSIDRKKEEPG